MSKNKNNMNSLVMLATLAMLTALEVILSRLVPVVSSQQIKVSFAFLPVAIAAYLYGIKGGALVAGVSDVIGALMFPVGEFFPGFTLTAALTGLIFGLCLHKRRRSKCRPIIAAALNCLLVTLVANTAMIAYISGNDFGVLFTTRIVQFFVMFPVQSVVLLWLNNSGVIDALEDKYK